MVLHGLKPAGQVVYLVSTLQYVVGVVLLGLFGYVLGNRIRRSALILARRQGCR